MSAASTWLKGEYAKWAFTAEAMGTRPTAWYMSLHTGDPGLTGANECTDSAYARKSVTLTRSGGSVSNSGAVTFNALADAAVSITHVAFWDAVTAGNCLVGGALTLAKSFAVADVPSFAASEATITVA